MREWHDFFKEKPDPDQEVLFFLYGRCYVLGYYDNEDFTCIVTDAFMVDEEEIEDERERGLYWTELPLPPQIKGEKQEDE